MSEFVIPSINVPSIPVASGGSFPVRRVYCVGQNYADHAIEMGGDPNKQPPFFFQKNADSLNASGEFPYPSKSEDVHYEAELLVALKSGGKDIAINDALKHVWGYAPALDMTRRDLQASAKAGGRPWEIAKAFDQAAPVGELQSVENVGHPSNGAIRLLQNGVLRQDGDLSQMIWKVSEMISYLSEYFELCAGDVILSGTPAGVGPVAVGDRLQVEIKGFEPLVVDVT